MIVTSIYIYFINYKNKTTRNLSKYNFLCFYPKLIFKFNSNQFLVESSKSPGSSHQVFSPFSDRFSNISDPYSDTGKASPCCQLEVI